MRESYGTARSLVAAFERLQLLREISGRQRGRIYVYEPYLNLMPETTAEGA